MFVYKQDPTVAEIAVRKAFLPKRVFAGPRDARIAIAGCRWSPRTSSATCSSTPTTQAEAFDAVHTFAIVRMTLTMYERGMAGATLPWQWNSGGNADPLRVFPRAGVTQNAFYSRTEKALKFFFFNTGSPPTQVFTCRSLDIVAHETGHAILDALKPGWLLASNPPQTGGLHESFGDLTAIFLALNQLDQCEALIAQTKADLHAKNFLSDLAEQFGLALGPAERAAQRRQQPAAVRGRDRGPRDLAGLHRRHVRRARGPVRARAQRGDARRRRGAARRRVVPRVGADPRAARRAEHRRDLRPGRQQDARHRGRRRQAAGVSSGDS